jgi:hypothetical protein
MEHIKYKINQYINNLKEIIIYSDSDILNIFILILTILTPWAITVSFTLPVMIQVISLLGFLLLFMGILEGNLAIKYWGLIILFLTTLTVLINCCISGCGENSIILYVINFIMIFYSTFRIKHELNNCIKRK